MHSENAIALASCIFEDILCHWGLLAELVTDNGPAFIQALDILADWYQIWHICIFPYNSQANGVVERRHFNVQEAIIKSSPGGGVLLAYCCSLSILGQARYRALVHWFVPLLHGSWRRATIPL